LSSLSRAKLKKREQMNVSIDVAVHRNKAPLVFVVS
jgi:hypothetical protein